MVARTVGPRMRQGKILLVAAALTAMFMLVMNAASRAQQAPSAAEVQALSQKLTTEINANLSCTTGAINLQNELVKANAEIKRLTDKYEPKKEAPPKK